MGTTPSNEESRQNRGGGSAGDRKALGPDATATLLRLRRDESGAVGEMFELLRGELRSLAGRYMAAQPAGHTLQPTGLVHEAYLRLIDRTRVDVSDRFRFMALAAAVMRSILVDHARKRAAEKRGGGRERVPLDAAVEAYEERAVDLVALDDALGRLAEMDAVQSRIVEARFFGGMTMNEIAEGLELSLRTAEREWQTARAWLRARIQADLDG